MIMNIRSSNINRTSRDDDINDNINKRTLCNKREKGVLK